MEQTTEYREAKGNRNVKSTLFPKVFEDKKELLELFNAVNGTNYQDSDDLEINTIEGKFEGNHTHGCLECEVRMLNINYGHNKALMEKCKRLEEYAIFIEKIRKYIKQFPGRLDTAITRAIEDCISENILKDFLIEQKSEVFDMVLYSFDKELYEKDLKQTAYDEGGHDKLMGQVKKKLEKKKSVEEIADALEETVETIQKIVNEIQQKSSETP